MGDYRRSVMEITWNGLLEKNKNLIKKMDEQNKGGIKWEK